MKGRLCLLLCICLLLCGCGPAPENAGHPLLVLRYADN